MASPPGSWRLTSGGASSLCSHLAHASSGNRSGLCPELGSVARVSLSETATLLRAPHGGPAWLPESLGPHLLPALLVEATCGDARRCPLHWPFCPGQAPLVGGRGVSFLQPRPSTYVLSCSLSARCVLRAGGVWSAGASRRSAFCLLSRAFLVPGT